MHDYAYCCHCILSREGLVFFASYSHVTLPLSPSADQFELGNMMQNGAETSILEYCLVLCQMVRTGGFPFDFYFLLLSLF